MPRILSEPSTSQRDRVFLSPDLEWPQLVEAHYRLQLGHFISRVEWRPGGAVAQSELSRVPMWNHGAWLRGDGEGLAAFSEFTREWMTARGQRPVIYLREGSDELKRLLAEAGYEAFDRESWMIFRDWKGSERRGHLQVRRAGGREAEEFVRVFYDAFQATGPHFGEALQSEILERTEECQHLIGYDGDKAVCVGTVIARDGGACLYNIGTSREARGKGYGRVMTEELVKKAQEELGAEVVFLQVDTGSGTERLYERVGFERVLVRSGFRMSEWSEGAGGAGAGEGRARGGRSFLEESLGEKGGEPAEEVERVFRKEARGVLQAAEAMGMDVRVLWAAAWALLMAFYSNEEEINLAVWEGASWRELLVRIDGRARLEELAGDVGRSWSGTEKEGVEGAGVQAGIAFGSEGEREEGGRSEGQGLMLWVSEKVGLARLRVDGRTVQGGLGQQVLEHLGNILGSLVHGRDQLVDEVEWLTADERREWMERWSRPEREMAGEVDEKTVLELFARRVEQRGGERALWCIPGEGSEGGRAVSYAELDAWVDRAARRLMEAGVGRGVVAGVFMDRRWEAVAAIWAVWRAGGTALLMDVEYPDERLAFMVEDSGLRVVLTSEPLAGRWAGRGVEVVLAEDVAAVERSGEKREKDGSVLPELELGDAAYLIYTSGSTGRPKGVVVDHGALSAHVQHMVRYYGIGERDRVLQFSSLSFDAALEQVAGALIAGACLVMRGEEVWSAGQFAEHLREAGITVADIPTAYWHQLAQEWSGSGKVMEQALRLVIIGGESMMPETVRLWRETPLKGARLINAYGPTEAVITATAFDATELLQRGKELPARIPIGRACGGRTAYVVNRWGGLCPQGGLGELWIGGLLARGYLGREELTRERFVEGKGVLAGQRLYRTGDQVQLLPEGDLDFLGRLDQQVKIRGFRIELGEVEGVLAAHEGVKEAAVGAVKTGGSGLALAGYWVEKERGAVDEWELRKFLRQRLPEYMVPSVLVRLEALPLLASGKVNRRALPEPKAEDWSAGKPVWKGPSDPLQLRLQLAFQRVLNRQPIGVDVSFFELGGNSLQALEVLVEIEKATGRQVALGTLFQANTVESLARVLQAEGAEEWSPLVPLQPRGDRPRLYFVHTTPGDVLGYGNLVYHLGLDQPCFGFQSQGLHREEEAHETIEEMAAQYVKELRKHGEGPYYLAGWCYGGIVAVEMAHQLLREKEDVALLALLETVAPEPSFKHWRHHAHRLRCGLGMGPKRWVEYLRCKLHYYRFSKEAERMRFKQADSGEGSVSNQECLARMEYVYGVNMRALKGYRARPYPGGVTLFNASVVDPAVIDDPLYGWPGLAKEIEVHQVPGDHDSMLSEPHVRELARQLRCCVDAAAAGVGDLRGRS